MRIGEAILVPERLHKVLARAGVGSRRACEDLIRDGRVLVDGEPAGIGMLVDPERQGICVDGKRVSTAGELYYFLVYKPKGYVSTASDPQGRPKVTDLAPLPGVRLYPVGRLDLQTSGLLILTNDGDLTFLLTHPKHDVWKTYQAQVVGSPGAEEIARLRQGVLLPEGRTAPARVKILRTLKEPAGATLLEIGLREGKKRQVRKMCEAIGHPVIELRRVNLAFLTLDGLQPGQYRRLTTGEVRNLKELALGSRNDAGEETKSSAMEKRERQNAK
jgi:pseudouridine synthase